jgi:hypothetical protein
VVILTALLSLVVILPGLNLEIALIPSYVTIKYNANTRVNQFDNGTLYVQVLRNDGTLETVYESMDADETINFAIGLAGSVFICYSGSDYEIDSTINMKTNVTVVLDTNVHLKQTNAAAKAVKFNSVKNAHLLGLGNAVISGQGIELNYAYECSVEDIEIRGSPNSWLYVHNSDDNVLENLYGHDWEDFHGILLENATGNKIADVISDGEHGPQTRSALVIGGSEGPSYNNQIVGGKFMGSHLDNAIYLGGWEYPVENNTLAGFIASGCQASGHAGIKLRPSSYNTITGFIVEDCYNGIEIGTTYDGESGYGSSIGNIFEGVIRDSINTGLILNIDGEGLSISKNTFTLTIQGSGKSGVWVSHDKTTSTIEHNQFNLVSYENYDDGVEIEINTAARVTQNYFKAVCTDNGGYGVNLHGSQASYIMDNRFDLVVENNILGDVQDEGLRTRMNGFGKEAAGAGNPPTASLWDVGDIVENTDDNAIWVKTYDEIMVKISGVP